MEVEKPAEEFSKEELRRQLYSSLRSTGVLDSMKGQLRARLLQHLRHHNGESIEVKRKQGKPSLTARLLSSLFLEYLEFNGFTFTISVFMPESQMASWKPFSYEEMLELLHLDPSSDLHIRLKLVGEGRECLAHQLVTVLQQQRAQRNCITEVSTQTSPAVEACNKHATRSSCTSPKTLERSMMEVEDAYIRKKEAHEAQRVLPYRSLEDKITILHQEFDARVNAEVALQVSRLRDYEINAARMDEAARYRRQLARDREELEDIHKSRMDRIKAREESLLERMLSKEKAIEASAYEQRQKILTEITSLRERENKLRQFKESQERREEKLDERELSLIAKEEEVVRLRKSLYAQADEITALRKKELEEQYKELCDRLQHDRTQFEAEREQMKEEKIAMAIELAASRSDKELVQALHHRLRMEEDQRLNLIKTSRELEVRLEESLKQERSSASAPNNISDQRLEERLRELQSELEQERLQRQALEKESNALERKLQQKKVELAAARAPQGEWITEHKNLMATIHQQDAELQKRGTKLQLMEVENEKLTTRHKKLLLKIDHLDTLVKEAQEEKGRAIHDLEILQDQHKTTEKELLETVTLLRKAKQALENERLDHCAVQSLKKTLVPSSSKIDVNSVTPQVMYEPNNSLFEPRPRADEIIRKKWESFLKKPRRESHDLWAHVLSDNAAKKLSHDQDLERIPVNYFPTSSISKPFSSGFGLHLLEMRDDGSLLELDQNPSWKPKDEAKAANPTDKNGWKGITVEELSSTKGGTEGNGSIAEIFTSFWDGERNRDDAIPSWRKTAQPGSWNTSYSEPKSSVQNMVTSQQCDQIPGNAWNLGHNVDHNHEDRISGQSTAFFHEEEIVAEKYDYQESLRGLQDLETTTEIHRANMLENHSPTTHIWSLKNSQEETEPLEADHLESFNTMKTITATVIIHRATPLSTSDNECERRLSNLHTRDDVGNHGHEGSKEPQGTSRDENEKSQISALRFTTNTNIQTSVDLVENSNFKGDSRDAEKQETLRQSQETPSIERTSPEPAEHVANNNGDGDGDGDSLPVNENLVTSHTKEDSGHVQEGADNSWNFYLGEEGANTLENSEAEDSLSQGTPSCACLASLKLDLESMEESNQSGDEMQMSGSCGPRMDSQTESEQHETVNSPREVPVHNLSMIRDIQPLNLATQSADHKEDCSNMKCEENIEGNEQNSRSEIRSEAVDEKTKQETDRDEVKETDAARDDALASDPVQSDSCEAHEPMKLTSEVNQVAMDLTSLVPIPTESEETGSKHSPTLSTSDGDSDKDLNKLMRCLGLTKDEQQKGSLKKEEEPLSLTSQNEHSRQSKHENAAPASGKMSGLPEIGEMLYKQEMQANENAQKNLPDHLQNSTTEAQNPPKGNNVNVASPPGSMPPGHDRHARETLRTSIVMRKQERSIDRETEKESPRIMDRMGGQKSHPTLALAIRNNRLVKLETQDEQQTPRSSFLNLRHVEATVSISKKTQDAEKVEKGSPNIEPGVENTCARAASHIEINSSSEESIYQGDSFEEDEEEEDEEAEGDQEPAYSEESCTNTGVQAPGSLGLERNKNSSPKSKGDESKSVERSSGNWEGESEQGSYSPDEDDTVLNLLA